MDVFMGYSSQDKETQNCNSCFKKDCKDSGNKG